MFTTPSSPDAARCWVPCLDNLWEKCTWEFEFVVPRYLEEIDNREEVDPNELSPTIVLCSGELVEQVRFFPELLQCRHLFDYTRSPIHTIPTKLYSYFHKQSLHLSITLPSRLDPSTFTRFLPTAGQMKHPVPLNRSCTHSACQDKNHSSGRQHPFCAPR